MEAQHNPSKVLRSMGASDRVTITRDKKIVAELTSPREKLPPRFRPDNPALPVIRSFLRRSRFRLASLNGCRHRATGIPGGP